MKLFCGKVHFSRSWMQLIYGIVKCIRPPDATNVDNAVVKLAKCIFQVTGVTNLQNEHQSLMSQYDDLT